MPIKHPAASLRRFDRAIAPATRLICFPNAGAGASVYRRFVALLPKSIEFLSVQLPGREDRMQEQPYLYMEKAVDDIVGEIAALPSMPTILFGHSMGALLAFEISRKLSLMASLRQSQAFQHYRLIVSGHNAPQVPDLSRRCRGDADDSFLIQDLMQLGGTPIELLEDPVMRAMILRVVRADYTLLDNYHYQEGRALDWPLIAFASRQDMEITEEGVATWALHCTKNYQEEWFEGDHFYLFADGNLFCERLRHWILHP